MDKAFDVILQTEVEAPIIAKYKHNSYGEHFRYKCLCCGEEVYLAAADSVNRTPHFRHRRGNNDTDCEKYLGQLNTSERLVYLRKQSQERIEFCFNRDRCTFEVGVLFEEDELSKCMEKSERLMVFTNQNSLFLSIPINFETMIPGRMSYFIITELSKSYRVSLKSDSNYFKYPNAVIRDSGKVTCFKVKKGDEHSPQQLSGILYSKTEYYAISDSEMSIHSIEALGEAIDNVELFSFTTARQRFYGIRFSIKQMDQEVLQCFSEHDYKIITAEYLKVLWPPVYIQDTDLICSSDYVYTYSSFPIIPYGNVNVNGASISKLNDNIHEIAVGNSLFVHEKNVDVAIKRDLNTECNYDFEEPKVLFTSKIVIPSNCDYYLFDKNGCSHLVSGSTVYLSGNDRIVGYHNRHVKILVYGSRNEEQDKKQLICEVLMYHPESENFIPDEFMGIQKDDVVLDYLEKCYRKGKINSVLRRYIKEGLI